MRLTALAWGMLLAVLPPAPLNASIHPSVTSLNVEVPLTGAEKAAQVEPYTNATTACIIQAMSKGAAVQVSEVTDRIVVAFQQCSAPARALIEVHDRLYGEGTGELFFNGPYLDALPAQVEGKF